MNDTKVRERTIQWNAPMETAQGVVGREPSVWMREMIEGKIPAPPAGRLMGFDIESADVDRVVFSMHAEEWMCNPAGVIHGGMIATLLDTVMSLAVAMKLPADKMCTSVDLAVKFVRPLFPTGEKVRGEGVAVHVGSTIGTAEGRIHDTKGRLIATGTVTVAVIDAMATKRR